MFNNPKLNYSYSFILYIVFHFFVFYSIAVHIFFHHSIFFPVILLKICLTLSLLLWQTN